VQDKLYFFCKYFITDRLFDHKGNEEILEEMTVEPADGKLRRYKSSEPNSM